MSIATQFEDSRAVPAQPAHDDLRRSVERWFLEHGLPHFVPRYSVRKGGRVPVLLLVLFVVFAFELSVEPWFDLTAVVLLVTPAVVIVLTWWVAPVFAPVLGVDWQPRPGPTSVGLRLGTAALALQLLVLTDVPVDAIIDFLVFFMALWASALLYRPGLWARRHAGRQDPRATALIALLGLAVVAFALEGHPLPEYDTGVDALAGAVLPGVVPLPHAVPALPIVVAILLLAHRLAPGDQLDPLREDGTRTAVIASVAPVLVIVLGGESTVLAEAMNAGWGRTMLPLAVAAVAILAAALHATRVSPGESRCLHPRVPDRIKGTITEPSRAGLALWITSYLLAFPVLFGIFAEVDVNGHRLDGVAAFAFTLAINAVYLGVVWMITSFGIDHLGSWAAAEARANVGNVVAGIARGLPLLLIVTAFSVLSADVWEAVARMRPGPYLALIALILAAAVTFAALSAKRELDKDRAAFDTWPAVRAEIAPRLSTPRRATKPPDFGPELEQALRAAAPSDAPLNSKLGIRRWLNLIGVLAVYQAFIFVPLMIAGAAVFWVIGRLAVRASVAGAWIYGDGSSTTLANALTTRPFFEQPWTRIAVLLGAFSSLYAVVQVLSTKEQRADFFRGVDEALRLRFAVLMAYDAVFATEADSARPREARQEVDIAEPRRARVPGEPAVAPVVDLGTPVRRGGGIVKQ